MLTTQRLVSGMETVIIPEKISMIASQVPITDGSKTPETSPLCGILRRDRRNRTRYRYDPNGEDRATAEGSEVRKRRSGMRVRC